MYECINVENESKNNININIINIISVIVYRLCVKQFVCVSIDIFIILYTLHIGTHKRNHVYNIST